MNIKQKKFVENRKYARFSVLEYALLEFDKKPIPARTLIVDISMGGAQLRSRVEGEIGDKAYLLIGSTKDTLLKIPVIIRYCKPIDAGLLYAIGLKFVPKTKLQRAQLINYVHSLFVSQGELILENHVTEEDFA